MGILGDQEVGPAAAVALAGFHLPTFIEKGKKIHFLQNARGQSGYDMAKIGWL